MAVRIAFICLIALLIFQVMLLDATVIRRDVDAQKSTSQTIDEAIQSFKSSLDDFVKNVQNNELLQNVSVSLKNFGEQVQAQGHQLVEKIQTASKTD